MTVLDVGRIVVGMALLVSGGELLVRGASALAARVGLSALVIGLTVVSFATSAPELTVTISSVLGGEPGLALGNVVGSNIANVLLVLGLTALLAPLAVTHQLLRFDLPLLVLVSTALLLVALDGRVDVVDGALLFAAVVVHGVLTVLIGRRDAATPAAPHGAAGDPLPTDPGADRTPGISALLSLVLVAAGVGLLVVGATVLVDGAVNIAAALGVSGLVIGLTVVAVGTSLPELATSVIAVRRGQRDLAVGNVVGSCLLNLGLVLGVPAMLFAGGLPVPAAAVALDIPVMLAAAVALLPIAFTGFAVARWEGALFLLLYLFYTGYVVLEAAEHDALDGFTAVLVSFVLPLLVLTLVAVSAHEVGRRRGRRQLDRHAGAP
ncbi:calcium/sodium antiporter [Kocuria sediminis]|uniref:Calcium/sodium antiporter n=1 Tax=Kocuria sediminis TaxID=1038857 RepID=A0A6N8GN04_9MICC|nr:calcium/sodium antiporter [Kocuria sediminis]MUN62643.1 calcium/sodium antiporter [Kocuria sediminis]